MVMESDIQLLEMVDGIKYVLVNSGFLSRKIVGSTVSDNLT
jgi:hypothetical protein